MITADDNSAGLPERVMRKAQWRLLPLIFIAYLIAIVDCANISFAAATMNADLGFTATVYGVAGGIFFLSYALLEVPSSAALMRFGTRIWLTRIMITLGLISAAQMFVQTPTQFYVLRFLLGAAEAGILRGAGRNVARTPPRGRHRRSQHPWAVRFVHRHQRFGFCPRRGRQL